MRNLLATKPYHKLRCDIVANPITTAAWLALSTAVPKGCTAIQVYYTGEALLKLSIGDMGAEDAGELPLYIVPGGEGEMVPVEIPAGKRLSVKAVDQNTSSGELVFNFFG